MYQVKLKSTRRRREAVMKNEYEMKQISKADYTEKILNHNHNENIYRQRFQFYLNVSLLPYSNLVFDLKREFIKK